MKKVKKTISVVSQDIYSLEDDQDGKEKEREENKIFIKEMPSPTLLQRSTSVEYEVNIKDDNIAQLLRARKLRIWS